MFLYCVYVNKYTLDLTKNCLCFISYIMKMFILICSWSGFSQRFKFTPQRLSSLSEGRWFPQAFVFCFFFLLFFFSSFLMQTVLTFTRSSEFSVQRRPGQLLTGIEGAGLFCRGQLATPTDKFNSAPLCKATALLFAS